ncbi:hypothetical protein [Amycolatopsis sp.]|uniref:hypothetical protein n=1 Tax=Amycolatopsis sp. TaxID=37632 RepID=UPI002632FB2D|nr:hypothetical protein [Amycolatopsis sp.]
MTWSDKTLASAAGMALVRRQLRRIARGLDPALRARPLSALAADQLLQRRVLRRYRSWLQTSSGFASAPAHRFRTRNSV